MTAASSASCFPPGFDVAPHCGHRVSLQRHLKREPGRNRVTRHLQKFIPVLAAGAALGACANGQDLLKGPSQLVTGAAATLAQLPTPTLPVADSEPTGSPTELYTRIARGVTSCWFGAHGALKGHYILHAEAEPPARGGRSELVIHEIDLAMPNPRGNRWFRVTITPGGDTATVESENIRFPIETGQSMRAQVRRWARGDLSCGDAQIKGWDAEHKVPDAPVKPRQGERRT